MLPVRNLILSEAAKSELERDLWKDRYVDGAMKTNGRTFIVQVRYRGGHTREYPKRSYEVVRNGEALHYNAEYDDPSMIRNALSFAFFPMLGVPAPRCKHVLMYRNGEPLGVYLEIEGVDKPFFRRREIGASSLFYAVNDNADFGLNRPGTDRRKSSLLSGYEYRFGGDREKAGLKAFIRSIHRRGADDWTRSLDTDNYLRWLAGAVLTGNYDGFEQNYAIYRHAGTGKYRMIPWDYEGTWGRNCFGRLQDIDLVPVIGYNQLTKKLMKVPLYRRQYADILSTALTGPFTESNLMPRVVRMISELSPYIREDAKRRWSYETFLNEPVIIRRYIEERRDLVYGELGRIV